MLLKIAKDTEKLIWKMEVPGNGLGCTDRFIFTLNFLRMRLSQEPGDHSYELDVIVSLTKPELPFVLDQSVKMP